MKRVLLGKISSGVYGCKVSKENVDVTTSTSPEDFLFDSTKHRTGIVYGGGFRSSGNSTIDFKGNKAELSYIPLVQYSEVAVGEAEHENISGGDEEYFWQSRENFHIFTKTSITPAILSKSSNTTMVQAGRTNFTTATNLTYKVLRIPCAYGYMTAANFSTVTTSSTKRVLVGKNTNSGHGFSSSSPGYGLFVSRPGKDVTSCSADELILNTDANQSGTSNVAKGMFQALEVRRVSNVPRADFQITGTSSGASQAVANIYSHLGTVGGVDLGIPALPEANITDSGGSGSQAQGGSTPNPTVTWNSTGTQATFTTSTNQLFNAAIMPTFSNLTSF